VQTQCATDSDDDDPSKMDEDDKKEKTDSKSDRPRVDKSVDSDSESSSTTSSSTTSSSSSLPGSVKVCVDREVVAGMFTKLKRQLKCSVLSTAIKGWALKEVKGFTPDSSKGEKDELQAFNDAIDRLLQLARRGDAASMTFIFERRTLVSLFFYFLSL
jgi:hypothetical protein